MEDENNLLIDLVYLWVDDTDMKWKTKINKFRSNIHNYDNDATDICRFYNNDELKFSLRSVEKNMPWVNRIYIVTDEQVPDWLDLNNEKIKIIDHKDIIPKDKLPLFNSCAIETRLPFIENLSEHFLYANDDMLVWNYVDKDFFFDSSGKAICRLDKRIKKSKKCNHLYGYTIKRAHEIISQKYNIPIDAYFPHHNIDAYRKSLFMDCINDFSSEFEETLNHRFREYTDMQRMGVTFYMLCKNAGIPRYTKLNWFDKYIRKIPLESKCYSLLTSRLNKIKKSECKLMCINDCRKTNDEDRENMVKLLLERFPEKSSFEK